MRTNPLKTRLLHLAVSFACNCLVALVATVFSRYVFSLEGNHHIPFWEAFWFWWAMATIINRIVLGPWK